jgi:hypothetical protein
MKRALIVVGLLGFLYLLSWWPHPDRLGAFSQFTSFDGPAFRRFHETRYARDYRTATTRSSKWMLPQRGRMFWDRWCYGFTASVEGPFEKEGLLYFRVEARHIYDFMAVYVFSLQGDLVEVTWVLLA